MKNFQYRTEDYFREYINRPLNIKIREFGKDIPHSKTYNGKDIKALKTTFTSPVTLEKDGHYFEVDVNLNTRPTLSGKKKTVFSVKFAG